MSILLDLTVKVSIIVLLAFAAAQLLQRRSAAVRHWVLAAAIACAAASPLLALMAPSWHIDLGTGSSVQRADLPVSRPAPSNSSQAMLPPPGESVETVASVQDERTVLDQAITVADLLFPIWVTGVVAGLCVLLIGFARLVWIESRSAPVLDGKWPDIAADIARRYRLVRPPLLLQSDHPALLATWGLRRSKVILPAAAPAWTEDRIRLVLGHELAHVRRSDWFVQIAAELVRTIYWFNPILWIGCRRLRQESEQACDDAVLQMGIEGPAYATHLLDLARTFRAHRRMWFPAPAIARPSSLERRVRAMLNTQVNRDPVTPFAGIAVIVAFLGITVSIAGYEAVAQARFATVSGTIIDQQGGLLSNATVVLSNVATKAKHEVRTDQTGYFELVGLPAGHYTLEARFMGFEPFRVDLSVGVGESLQRNITLHIGAVQETITVRSQGGSNVQASRAPRAANRPRFGPCGNPGEGGCISPPLKVKDVRPTYPSSVAESGVRGVVALEGVIGTDGRMKDLRVVSSPHPDLDRLALEAVGQWEFEPTTLNGRVVETRINTGVYFDVAAPPPPPPAPPAP